MPGIPEILSNSFGLSNKKVFLKVFLDYFLGHLEITYFFPTIDFIKYDLTYRTLKNC